MLLLPTVCTAPRRPGSPVPLQIQMVEWQFSMVRFTPATSKYTLSTGRAHTHTLEHSQKPRSIHCGTEQQETGLSSHEDSINIWQNINAPGVSDAQYLSTRLSAPALSENLFSREQFLPHAKTRICNPVCSDAALCRHLSNLLTPPGITIFCNSYLI